MTTSSHESVVPAPPMSANSGQSTPRQLKFGRARNASSSFGRFRRSWMTAACATVNESIAPNEYIVLEEVRLAGQEHEDREDAREDDRARATAS